MDEGKISYAEKEIFVGIDVHKRIYSLCVVCDGQVVKRCRVPASGESVVHFLEKYFEGAKMLTCYEAGFSGFWLRRHLTRKGIKNLVVHPAAVEICSRDRVKTDKRDSSKLATQLASGRLRSIRVPTEEEERARLLTRTRADFVRSISRLRNQIRMKLHQFGLIDGEDQRALSRKTVGVILLRGVPPELELILNAYLRIWQQLLLELRALEREREKRTENNSIAAVWRTIPGFGPGGSAVMANELGDMNQFQNERALFSFTGLTPGEHSSGEAVHRGHISRQGSGLVRCVLVEAAWRAVRKDEALKKDFEHIAARRGKKRAIVAIARKLVGRARAVFRTQRDYVGDRVAA